MANQKPGLMGQKVGMTQIYVGDVVVPVTVIDCSGNTTLRIKTEDSKDGYSAVQLGHGDKKESRTSQPMQGVYKALGTSPKQTVREVRIRPEDANRYTAGQTVKISDVLSEGQKVDVSGVSKGRGFAGVMKRYNFRGFIRTHGTHEFFRHGGSIGTRLTPGHVIKGKKMPGHMGNHNVTIQNVELVKIDEEKNLIYVKGGVPGPNKGLVMIRQSIKG